MLTYIRVRFIDQTRISEYAMGDRNETYNLVNMLEQNNLVDTYWIYRDGKQIFDYHTEFGFSSVIPADKFSTRPEIFT